MKRLIYILLLILPVLFQANTSKATHVMGSDLTWTCVGQDSFLVRLVVYRDCNGIYLSSTPITFKCATTGATITTLSIAVGTPVDITPVCNTSCTRCQSLSCSFPYGIHRFTMQGIVRLSNAGSCCQIAISWQQCCRNGAITTGAGSANFYMEAIMNRCQNPCDNSPTFTNAPVAILCVGQDFTFNHGVNDVDVGGTGGLLDSLTYEWGHPLSASNTNIAYTGQYAYDKAIYFWGFPNANLPFPRGIHLDGQTGDVQFRPMKAEVTVMVVKINEFRNGTKIAEIRRDLQIIVITCTNNNPPQVTTPNNVRSKSVCAGETVTFNFSTSDPNANDTVTISWNNAIPGAIWTHTNNQAKHPTATLSWTPTDGHVSSLPYTFTVTAKDNACPVRASFTQAYQITVKPRPRANIIVSDSGCGLYYFMAQRIEGSGPSYQWLGQSFQFIPSVGPVTSHKFAPGIYPYTMTMTASGCTNTYFDTVEVDTFILNIMPRDTHLCYGATITVNTNVRFNQGAITMRWGSGSTVFSSDTGFSKTFTITRDTTIWSEASDTMGCRSMDSTHYNMHMQPEVDLGPDVRICTYGQADMNVQYTIDEGRMRRIRWTEMLTSTVVDMDTMFSSNDSGTYICAVTDTFNCVGYDTIDLVISPEIVASIANYPVICYGDEAELEANPTGGGNAVYLWYEGAKLVGASRKIKVKPLATTDYWLKISETIDGVTCKDSVMVRVRVNPLPVITISPIDKRCVNGTMIVLNNFVKVDGSFKPGGIWSSPSNGLVGDRFSPIAAGVSTPPGWKVKYEYTDPITLCYNKDSSYVTIWALPTPFAGKDDSICTGTPIALTGAPISTTATWRGTGVEGSYPNWRFNPDASGIVNGGNYNAIYHYTDLNGCENEDTMQVTVFRMPVVEAGNAREMCIDAAAIDLTGIGDPIGGIWKGTGVVGNLFYPDIAKAGTHSLTYTYTNVICSSFDKVNFTVHDLPVVTANTLSGDRLFCRNYGIVQLNGQPSGTGGKWSGPGVNGTTFNTVIGADQETDYTLRYDYTDNHGCKNYADLTVKVRPEPTVTIDPNADKLCFGNPYTVRSVYTHADGVRWSQGVTNDGSIQGAPTSTQIGYMPGVGDLAKLYFWLHIITTHSDNICAPAKDSIKVNMSAMPEPEFGGTPLIGCAPLQVQFLDSSTIAIGTISSWIWTFSDGTTASTQNPLHTFQKAGRYGVSLKVVSDAGCEKEISKNDYVEAYVVPNVNFIPKPELALLSVPTIVFDNRTLDLTPQTEYSWNFGDYDWINQGGGTSTDEEPTYKYSDTGHYQVRLIALNEYGCTDTMIREVVILPDVTVFTPNAFTPDNTGPAANNVFRTVVGGIMTFEVKIFDRWGQMMYESHDYESHGWNGTYVDGHTAAPMDVYVYVIKVKGLDGIDYKYTGSIALLK